MKSWCDLSWREKRNIEEGKVNSLSYQTGYEFIVKQKVAEGKEQKKKPTKHNQERCDANEEIQ